MKVQITLGGLLNWQIKFLETQEHYLNLINGYKEPFLKTGTPSEEYLAGTTLDEIHALYEFDRHLRIITLEYILEIEKTAKSLIAHIFPGNTGIGTICVWKISTRMAGQNIIRYVICLAHFTIKFHLI